MQKFLALLMLIFSFQIYLKADQVLNKCARQTNGQCTRCWEGNLVNGKCLSSDDMLKNCEFAENGKCSYCKQGYYQAKKYGECNRIQNLEYCIRSDNLGKNCLVCEQGIKVQDGKCDPENECEQSNCDYCSDQLVKKETPEGTVKILVESCMRCENGWVLFEEADNDVRQCKEQKDHTRGCYLLDQYNQCQICNQGYQMNENGRCDYVKHYQNSYKIQIISMILAILML